MPPAGQDKAQQQSLSEENLKLLEIQNPKLAQEGIWAHATAQVEKGGLLLATPDNPRTLGTEMFWWVVRMKLCVCGGGARGQTDRGQLRCANLLTEHLQQHQQQCTHVSI